MKGTAQKSRTALSTMATALREVAKKIVRAADISAFHDKRLSAIEDRLARLDGGAEASTARRAAFSDLIFARAQAGTRGPRFRLHSDDADLVIWLDEDAAGKGPGG